MKSRKFYLLLFSLIFSCGVKRPPEPAEAWYPKKVENLKMIVREGCAYLNWEYPGEKNPEKYLIYRKELAEPGGFKIELAGEVAGKESAFVDCTIQSGRVYAYQIVALSSIGTKGEPGEWLWLDYFQSPSPPRDFQARSGDKFVDLTWQGRSGESYNLYRSLEPGRFPSQPLNSELIKNFSYTDLNLENNQTYYYCLRAVIEKPGNPRIESKCALARATPIDLIPPARPRGLSVILTEQGVELHWFKSSEPDLLGYLVFRRKKGSKNWTQITKEPLAENYFLDTKVKNLSGWWEYAVSSLDNSPQKNQSPLSEIQAIYIP